MFEESEVFRAMLSVPVPPGHSRDGLSDEQPLRLNGISKLEFQGFLRALMHL